MTVLGEKVFNLLSLADVYHLTYGREIITGWAKDIIKTSKKESMSILDIGCGTGTDLLNIKNSCSDVNISLYGIECYKPSVDELKKQNITVFSINAENESIPVENESFDIIIVNQFVEHTKEIFWIFSEISRVIKKDGHVIVGVPNIAAWSNRIWLLFGLQPSCINLLGPHVRGFSKPDFKSFIETDGYFMVKRTAGSNFWLPSIKLNNLLSRLFPTLSVSLFFLIKREQKEGEFINVLETRFFETNYYKGQREIPQNTL